MLKGRCDCGSVTYELATDPIYVHCCHCRHCQRQTGSGFVLNAMIEAERITVDGPVREVVLASPSGKGQKVTRCADCGVAVFSAYLVRGENVRFIRVGTLDDPGACPPDVHVFAESKLPWITLDGAIPVFEQFYDREVQWPRTALQRWHAVVDG